MDSSNFYDTPAVAICPRYWTDTNKVRSLGLSTEAVKFSLGYAPLGPKLDDSCIEQAKSEFFQFYTLRNISSLLEFYKMITVDIEPAYTDGEFHKATSAMKFLDKNAIQLATSYVHYQMCYIYELYGIHYRFSSSSSMYLKLATKSLNLDATGVAGVF